ncbi:MAG: SRPBCC family protein, partial [Pseudomonadota bacterium]|nr:SRPBCC family protein [Pseudomonadota bacterium]
STRTRMRKNGLIDIELLNGPFRHLEGRWRFDHLENAHCRIRANMGFEVRGRLLSQAMGPLFKEFIHVLINSFEKRAMAIYGPPGERKS